MCVHGHDALLTFLSDLQHFRLLLTFQRFSVQSSFPPASHTLSIQGKGASITRLRQYVDKWRQWLWDGFGWFAEKATPQVTDLSDGALLPVSDTLLYCVFPANNFFPNSLDRSH
jgi:hypothetical protein